MFKLTCGSLASVLVAAAGASAQLTPIGQFVGDESEGFENVPTYQCPPCFYNSLSGFFNGQADMKCTQGNCIHITGSWGFQCSIRPNSGGRLFGSPGTETHIDFLQLGTKFGGYFGTNSGNAGGSIDFWDANGALIGSQPLDITADCVWAWKGWESTTPFKRVTIRGPLGGGFHMLDDLEVSFGPAGCYADCDTSTGPGVLDIFDFLCFGNRFSAGDPYACDCDTSTGLGVCDIFDFLCFGNAFNAGCP